MSPTDFTEFVVAFWLPLLAGALTISAAVIATAFRTDEES